MIGGASNTGYVDLEAWRNWSDDGIRYVPGKVQNGSCVEKGALIYQFVRTLPKKQGLKMARKFDSTWQLF